MDHNTLDLKMIVEKSSDLGDDALNSPLKYNGFMGISILHKFFGPKRMKYYIDWGSRLFKEFVIILMDDPDRHNFKVFNNLTEEEALHKAREISDEVKRSYEKIIEKKGLKNVKVIQFRDFANDPRYLEILSCIESFKKEDTFLKDSLDELIEIGVGGKLREFMKKHNIESQNIKDLFENVSGYIIEELASIIYLTESGYTIEVDPTIEFSTKTLIYDGRFPKIAQDLKLGRRGHIYAHPEGVYKNSY